MRRVPETGYPEKFLFEVKFKGQIIRKYLAKMVRDEWTTVEFPLNFNKETPVDEITVTFANDQVGSLKKGAIHLKNFILDLKPEAPPAEETPAAPPVAEAIPTPPAEPADAPAPPIEAELPASPESIPL